MTAPDKGWTRQAFEHTMKLGPERTAVDKYGHYIDKHTHEMWSAFKHGLAYSPHRGTFVIAEIQDSRPLFNPQPQLYSFKDQAKAAMRELAERRNVICAVFQQVTVLNPANNANSGC